MSEVGSSQRRLVADLVADLQPVRRLGAPWLRAILWVGIVVLVALGLAGVADLGSIARRLTATPDMALAAAGSSLTAVLASLATFELGLPDRSPLWALLPVPGLLLWIGASGFGCARGWLAPATSTIPLAETAHCLRFIIGLSIPLSALTFVLLRRSYTLYPTLLGGTAGLAVAAAAATLLNFFHPFDAAFDDLLVHGAAVLIVVGINRAVGGWLLAPKRAARPKARAA